MAEKPQHVSYSSLSQADNCLAWYKATRIDRVPEPPSKAREVGLLVHEMIALDLQARLDGETLEDAAYSALMRASTTVYYEEAKRVYEGWQRRFSIATENLVEVEGYFHRELDGVPEVVGYPDVVYRADGLVVPRDNKSGWGGTISDDYAFQGDVMAWLLAGQWSKQTIRPEIEFVRTGDVKPLDVFDGYRAALTEQRIRRVWARLETAYDTNEWTVTPGRHCAFCPVNVACAKSTALQQTEALIVTENDAQAALLDLARMKAATKTLESALKDFVSNNGDVSARGVVATYEHSETIGCTDIQGLIEKLGPEKALPILSVNGKAKGVAALKKDSAYKDFFGVTGSRNTFKVTGSITEPADEAEAESEVA